MGTECITRRKAHVLILPLEEQGHFSVYLHLLYYLSRYDIRVTFCSTKERCQELTELQSKGAFQRLELHLQDIFSPPEPNAGPKKEGDLPPLWKHCSNMEAKFNAYLPRLMDEKDPDRKPTILLADLFLGWTEGVAEKLDIPRYVVFTGSSCAPWSFVYRMGANCLPDDFMDFPGMHPVRVKDAIPPILESLVNLKNAAGIICNSFDELEKGIIDAVHSHLQKHRNSSGQVIKFLPIGPTLLLPGNPTSSVEKDAATSLNWLDSRARSSVLYAACGTQAKLAAKTITELAHGLEASNVPFLWALRLPIGVTELSSVLPPGFLERTKDRGHVEAGFAPQWEILNHPSVGGFLSHCGWNSSIESICAGVPVVPHPFHGDQPLNARVLAELPKTAIPIPRSKDGGFDGHDISTTISALMTEVKGEELRTNAARWKEVALASQGDDGSPSARQLLQDIFDSATRT